MHLSWLRRKLDLSAADAETIMEALLEQYYAAHPGAAASQVLMEQWLDRHLQMPKSKRTTTAQAMAQRGPRARVVEFAGIGHAPTLIANDQVQLVREFLLAA